MDENEKEGKGSGKKSGGGFDIATPIGLALAIGLCLYGIAAGDGGMENVASFIDPASVAIVCGGLVGCMLIMYPLAQFKKIPKHLKILILPKKYMAAEYIEILTECAKKARMSGLLSLEEDANSMTDPFMRSSVQMVVDSVDPETVQSQMEAWIENVAERHSQEATFYDKGAALAPGFGMIGTLIGLINLMKSLDDIDSIGPNMSVALLTTLYGSFLANVIFTPFSNKLTVRHQEEYLCMMVIFEGVKGIQAGESPALINQKLMSMLPEYIKNKKSKGKKGESAEGGDE